jgi:glucoamylase
LSPRWTTSAKSGVGSAITNGSRVWFTLAHGIVTEVYYPGVDQANVRDLGLLVTDSATFFSEEKRDTRQSIEPVHPGVPAFRLTNTCLEGRYRIDKIVFTDPLWDALVQRIRFDPLIGSVGDFRLYALLAPHIENHGYGNNGWTGTYKGVPMLFAQRGATALALACSTAFQVMSCGYVGVSDGWQDISRHKQMLWRFPSASDGNLGLTGEIDPAIGDGSFTLALGFGRTPEEAAERARAAVLRDGSVMLNAYVEGWRAFQATCLDLPTVQSDGFDLYRSSVAVLKTHATKGFPGGICASLSIPWGEAKGDTDLGGYHLIWPRDLVESAGGLLAAGDVESALLTLVFLVTTQEADGHWPQNMWVTGMPWWNGIQLDEAALPILLAYMLRRQNVLGNLTLWPVVRKAAAYLVCNGPVTQQDRWEEDPGYTPFTLAAEIAALLAAADFADIEGESATAAYLRETADYWNSRIETWLYTTNTELARRVGVEGYYVRITEPPASDAASPLLGYVAIKNRPYGQGSFPATQIVSPDALALVRFGLRSPQDPRIVSTVQVIDALLKTETATGPVWHRYNDDGYGDHDDGSPFDGTGVGRGWPLLAGERAHYELAAGNRAEAERLLAVMTAQSQNGLIPEQVWDGPNLPERGLMNGRPAGSAMPLVWAHAEYVKLLRSLRDGAVFDMPPQTVRRYVVERTGSPYACWRFNNKLRSFPAGKMLRIETAAPALVHWSADGWQSTQDSRTRDTGLGVHIVDLPPTRLPPGTRVRFTFYWLEADHWEGTDFEVTVGAEIGA